jgi:non-heme chloroperoxidase
MSKKTEVEDVGSRRKLLVSAATVAAGAGLAAAGATAAPAKAPAAGTRTVDSVITKDGTRIHFRDWGSGAPVLFSHGWPLQGDAWEDQMMFLASHGYRVIAHDRRGHGLSSQPWTGNDMDTYADDLATLIETLDLHGVTLVGHSTGGGEVAHYIGRHGSKRVAKAVLVGAVPPQMVRSPTNPDGLPMSVFDGIRAAVLADRSQFFKDLSLPFYGYNREGAKPSQGVRDTFWAQGMQCGIKNAYDCIKEFSEVDYTADLEKIDVPTLIVHGSDDQIVPIDRAGKASARIVKNAKLLIYEGAPHGLPTTHKDRLNADLLAFLQP